jgi:hypothetical protein
MHGFSGGGELVDDLVDFELRAHIDAACRFIEQDDARLGEQGFAEHDFLLVAAGEFAHDGVKSGRFDAQIEDAWLRWSRRCAG